VSSVIPSIYILRLVLLFSDTVGNEKLSQTNRIHSITVASDLVSLHYATIGAFIISEEAIAPSSLLRSRDLFREKDN